MDGASHAHHRGDGMSDLLVPSLHSSREGEIEGRCRGTYLPYLCGRFHIRERR